MEVNQKRTPVEGLEMVSVTKFVIPQDELKKFYLQEAVVYYTQGYGNTNRSELQMLCTLQNTYQKSLVLLSMLNSYSMKEGLTSLQKLVGDSLINSELEKDYLNKMNDDIAGLMEFLMFIAANRTVIGKLFAVFSLHNENVKKLLKTYPEYAK